MTDRVVQVAGLEVAVKDRPARSTMEITVNRDGSVFVAVPAGTPDDPVRAFVDRKQDWIHRKLVEKADFLPVLPPKELVNGEGFRYLGRNYRLLLVADQEAPVKLAGGRLRLHRGVEDGAAAIKAWYRAVGSAWLGRRVVPWADRCGVSDVKLIVRDLGYRWGSFGSAGQMNINWATVQLPSSLIDYVLVHELTHQGISDHGQRFWQRVERVLPDSGSLRASLAEEGVRVWLGATT